MQNVVNPSSKKATATLMSISMRITFSRISWSNASDQWLAATGSAIAHDDAASPLHRVVPSARPHRVGTPPRDDWILQGRRGGQPIRVARRPGPLAQATRAAWIYIAMLTPPASLPAPRRCFSPSAPHGWLSIGALADRRYPPLSRSALRSELRPPGRAAIRVISTSSLHLKRGTIKLISGGPSALLYSWILPAV